MLAIQSLRVLCDRVQTQIGASSLFPKHPTIKVEAEETVCPCGGVLKVQKTRIREKIVTLQIGQFELYEIVKYCPVCQKVFMYDDVRNLVPEFCNFGYDIIEYVGRALFLEHRTIQQIMTELKKKNVTISDREIAFLGRKFIFYLVQAQKDKSPEIKQLLLVLGGYILHFDATCNGKSPHLLCAIAETVDLVLGSVKVPSESTEAVVDFLTKIKKLYGTPLAGVSDMLKANLAAFEIVFPGIKHFICHFHFLRDIGKDMMEYDYATLREGLKRYGTQTRLREISKKLKEAIHPGDIKLLDTLDNDSLTALSKLPKHLAAHVLTEWVRDFESELHGYGFPFDKSYLVLFQRMREAYQFLRGISLDVEEFAELKIFLSNVVGDPELQYAVSLLEKKSVDFDLLRNAMRIAPPEGKEGLNDDGEESDMITIKKAVTEFVGRDEIKNNTDISYQKMLKQIKKYWDKLFADPIDVTLLSGEKIKIYPQRTNNLLERFFRDMNRGSRKRSGCKSLGRILQTMLAETPIVKNLNNPKYVEIILNGKLSLAARFVELDAAQVRNDIRNSQHQEEKLPVAIKKLIKVEGLPRQILGSKNKPRENNVIAA